MSVSGCDAFSPRSQEIDQVGSIAVGMTVEEPSRELSGDARLSSIYCDGVRYSAEEARANTCDGKSLSMLVLRSRFSQYNIYVDNGAVTKIVKYNLALYP
jgi:hypothetical protein